MLNYSSEAHHHARLYGERCHQLDGPPLRLVQVMLTYFRVLKRRPPPPALFPAVMEGLAKFVHLVNLDTVQDLLDLLKDLLNEVSKKGADGTGCSLYYQAMEAFVVVSAELGESCCRRFAAQERKISANQPSFRHWLRPFQNAIRHGANHPCWLPQNLCLPGRRFFTAVHVGQITDLHCVIYVFQEEMSSWSV